MKKCRRCKTNNVTLPINSTRLGVVWAKKYCKKCSIILSYRKAYITRRQKILIEGDGKNSLSQYDIFHRDGFKCIYCGGTSYQDNKKLIIEHIVPASIAQNHGVSPYCSYNRVTACEDCNAHKNDRFDPKMCKKIRLEVRRRNLIFLPKPRTSRSKENLIWISEK